MIRVQVGDYFYYDNSDQGDWVFGEVQRVVGQITRWDRENCYYRPMGWNEWYECHNYREKDWPQRYHWDSPFAKCIQILTKQEAEAIAEMLLLFK